VVFSYNRIWQDFLSQILIESHPFNRDKNLILTIGFGRIFYHNFKVFWSDLVTNYWIMTNKLVTLCFLLLLSLCTRPYSHLKIKFYQILYIKIHQVPIQSSEASPSRLNTMMWCWWLFARNDGQHCYFSVRGAKIAWPPRRKILD
jgi:hypothetical protein